MLANGKTKIDVIPLACRTAFFEKEAKEKKRADRRAQKFFRLKLAHFEQRRAAAS